MLPRILLCLILSSAMILSCQNDPNALDSYGGLSQAEAETLFGTKCASCHMDGGQSRAPGLVHLGNMTPRSIFASMESGKMQTMATGLSEQQMVAISELLTNRRYSTANTALMLCESPAPITETVKYLGWGGDKQGSGLLSAEIAGMTKEEVPTLELAWAFGFDGGSVTRAKPTIIGEVMIFGSQFGEVYCLDKVSGCVRWYFEADANVRGGLAVSESESGLRVHFADFAANVYALSVQTGELLWKSSVKNEPTSAVTGTPVAHDGLLYIPLSSMEVVSGAADHYECCKGSGQVVAVDAATGEEVWRHRVIQEVATVQGKNDKGTTQYGPSGAPVWGSPTVDAKRGYLYIGTGENNSKPWTETSDAIQALDLATGKLIWSWQATSADVYINGCPNSANCPDDLGPDVDFGMAPVLVERPDGQEVLVVGQKSGVLHCLSPDDGSIIWQTQIGRGGALGGIHWGLTTDGEKVYVPNSDWLEYGGNPEVDANPGLFSVNLMDGEIIWQYQASTEGCKKHQGCYPSHSAAPTMIPGVVFAGSLDGIFRAHDAETGEVIWETNTNKEFDTINGIPAHGGAIDGPGPVIADGMVYLSSGYALFGQMPGNVFLAFSIKK